MEAEHEDDRKKMYFLEEELSETRNKSDETVTETIYDAHRQVIEMEDQVYELFSISFTTNLAAVNLKIFI